MKLINSEFVPVAFDQFYQRQQKDAEGNFYRRIAGQSRNRDFSRTTQGCYVADAAGNLYGFNNNYGPENLHKMMRHALNRFNAKKEKLAGLAKIKSASSDPNHARSLPDGATVIQVNSRVKAKIYTKDERRLIFGKATSRDNLWLLEEEKQALAAKKIPKSLFRRMARFHLVDNTRGEPSHWKTDEIKRIRVRFTKKNEFQGTVHLETADKRRGYVASFRGFVEFDALGELDRFDVVVRGNHWGKGKWVSYAPRGEFPLLIAFRVADKKDVAYSLPPHGTKGWLEGYYEN